jgi:putative Ca2+/H+ antiporter (TMEM165/GDT1 family)
LVISALILSFAVIFIAEMGDKTQLVAMMFALRYRWWIVLSAILTATVAVHLFSVAIGHFLGAALPTHLLGIIAGVMFVFFGLWTLRGDSLSEDEANKAEQATGAAFFVVTSAFFLAELGDKTMLATVTLAADKPWFAVWIGSTLGMVAADALAILVGVVAGKHLPERLIQIVAAGLFIAFGAYMLIEGFYPGTSLFLVIAGTLAAVAAFAGILWALPQRFRPAVLKPAPAAEKVVAAAENPEAAADLNANTTADSAARGARQE